MNTELKQILDLFRAKVREWDKEAEQLGGRKLGFCEIRLLGQFSLLATQDLPKSIQIRATLDVDAIFSGDHSTGLLFRDAVKECGFEFDDLSGEIWLPANATFNVIAEEELFKLSALDPLSAIVSKAVKAPEKNKVLVRQAIEAYGDRLMRQLQDYKVDLNFFRNTSPERKK